jgi:predicted DNA-binding transcriptional regulator AlpA
MSNEVITHKHELQLLQSRISTSNSRTQHSGSCAVRDAATEGNVEITQWVRGLFSELDRIAKDAATMADENQPLLGGEHYLTDRELSQRLKISRRTLQDYRNNGILPYRQLGGKILYRESDIERVLQSCYRGKF